MSEEIPPIVFDSVHYHDELGEHRLTSEQKIRVVSWNVLADSCRKYHPNADLDKYQRDAHALLERVLNDFLSKQVDIICLQEVDNGVVSQVLAPSYFGRTTPNRLSCQIWARRGLWVPVGEARVVKMNDLATNGLPKKKYWRQKPKTKFQERFLTDNFGIIAKFKHNASGRKICVSNTLLYGDSKYDNIKLCQVDYIARNIRSYLTGSDRDIPILFCGDLNSLPGTAVHKYLTKRGNTVPDFSLDRLRRDCQPGDMVLSSFAVSLFGTQSPFRFRNSYNETAKYFTNVTSKFTGFLEDCTCRTHRKASRRLIIHRAFHVNCGQVIISPWAPI